MATCIHCAKSWTGHKPAHCTACHETFGGTVSGDRHRVGDWTDSNPRRCLAPAEMIARGLTPDHAGIWRQSPPGFVAQDAYGLALMGAGTDTPNTEADRAHGVVSDA